MAAQKEFPFDRREKFDLLRRAVDGRLPLDLARVRGLADRLFRLLEQIELCTTRGGECVAYLETLAAKCRCGKTALRKAIAAAESLGWLLVDRTRRDETHGGQTSNGWRIDWYAIRRAVGGSAAVADEAVDEAETVAAGAVNTSYAPIRSTEGGVRSTEGGGSLNERGGSVKRRAYIGRNPNLDPNLDPSPLNPPSLVIEYVAAAPASSRDLGEWAAVADRLRDVGLGDVEGPLDECRLAGGTPDDVLAVLDHWQARPGAWSLGFLHYRIRTARPGVDPSAGWPPVSIEYQRRRDAARRREEIERLRREAAEPVATPRVGGDLDLERRYGATLDALDEAGFGELLAGLREFDRLAVSRAGGRARDPKSLARLILLGALAARDQASNSKGAH